MTSSSTWMVLPRMPDGNGFMAGVLGPGGAMYQVSPDGEKWELLSVGYRNPYQPDTMTLQQKVDWVRRFGDDVIAGF